MDRPHSARTAPAVTHTVAGQVIVIAGDGGGARDALTRRVIEQAEAAGTRVSAVANDEEARTVFEPSKTLGLPTVFVVGPGIVNPAKLARRLREHDSSTYVIFAVDPEREQQLRRDFAYAVPFGSQWSIEAANSGKLASVIANGIKTLARQRRLRTTLDRMNLHLATPVPPDGRDHRRLVLSDRYLASILTHAQDAIVSLDQRGRVVSWNAGAERLFSVKERDAIGQSIVSLLRGAPLEDTLHGALRGGSSRQELRLARPEGEKVVDATFTPIFDEMQQPIGIAAILRDVTERVHAENAVRESEERLRSILDRAPAVVFMKDREGRYLFINAECLRIFARRRDDILGKTDAELFPEPVARYLRENDDRVWRTGEPLAIEESVPQTDGMHSYIAQKFLLRDSTGTAYALCGIASDISERLRIEHALRDSDRRKDEFLATLAHELRNPLAPIRHATTIAGMQGVSPEKLQWSREVIERQVRHMARLLDDLLDVSRITRGKLDLRKERVYLASVIGTAIEAARPLIEAKKHKLTVDMPLEAIRLEADPIRLAQIFSNLLTNAAKYTDPGGRICVHARLADQYVQVHIRDNGIGIAATALPQLFQMFSQATPVLERSEAGLGIGLALVRGLVELHQGTVEARSEGPGRGSEFVVRLPTVPADTTPALDLLEEDNGRRHALGAALRVLVADDNRDSLESLAVLLQLQGYETHTAHDGREAISTARRVQPEVVILDIGMPEINGYEVAQQMRREPWGRNALLVAFSGWGQEQDKRRAQEAGFDHHFTKPLNVERLLDLLANVRPSDHTRGRSIP